MRKIRWWIIGGLLSTTLIGLTACQFLVSLPQAYIIADPTSGPAPLEVTFDISDSRGQVYTIDFGDGSPEVSGVDFTEPIEHVYGDPGTYTVTLTVEDARGNTDQAKVTIEVGFPPLEAVLVADPTEGTAPLTVTFDLSGTIGEVAEFTLITGDGGVYHGTGDDIGTPIEHTYNNPGEYAAILLVEDIWGQESFDSEMIEVSAP